MKQISPLVAICIGILSFRPGVALAQLDDATLEMRCYNPFLSVSFIRHQTFSSGRGRGYTAPVRFNIDAEGPADSTISVNDTNNGICTATIDDKHIITGGYATITDGYILGAARETVKLRQVVQLIQPSAPGLDDKITFIVQKPENADSHAADVTVVFSVNYRKITH